MNEMKTVIWWAQLRWMQLADVGFGMAEELQQQQQPEQRLHPDDESHHHRQRAGATAEQDVRERPVSEEWCRIDLQPAFSKVIEAKAFCDVIEGTDTSPSLVKITPGRCRLCPFQDSHLTWYNRKKVQQSITFSRTLKPRLVICRL